MADVQWIKIYVNMFDVSRKIKRIEQMKNGDAIIVIWFKLLCLAGTINDGGAIYVTRDIPFTLDELADELRKKADIVKSALDTFEKYGMTYKDDAGFIFIKNWEKYQNLDGLEKIREQNRLRKQKQRDKSRDSHVTEGEEVTGRHATEEEREKEEEKEIHSSNLSIAREENNLSKMREFLCGELGGGVVFLSDDQMHDLLDKLTIDEFNYYVGVVRDQELAGKHYKKKTHYKAILDMAMKDRKIK